MSDSDQNYYPNPHQSQPMSIDTESLSNNFPLLKEVLTGPQEQLLQNIEKLNLLTEEEKKILKKCQGLQLAKINMALLDLLKKVTNWKIDHLKFYQSLQKISQFFEIDITNIYRSCIYEKIQNGLDFIQLFNLISGKISSPHPRGFGQSSSSSLSLVLQNCYEVIRNDTHQQDPKYQIYCKRYACLNLEQKLLYQIKLLIHLIAIPSLPQAPQFDPLNPAPIYLYSANQQKQQNLADVQKIYKELETTSYSWLLEELLDIDCQKTIEYKKIIAALDLIPKENQEEEIRLDSSTKIQSKLITKAALKKCIKIQREYESNLLSQGNFLESKGKIFLKYNILQLSFITVEYVGSVKQSSRNNQSQPNINEISFKKNYINTVEKVYLLIKQVTDEKPIYIYEDCSTFKLIPSEQQINVILFCLKIIEKLIQYGLILKRNNITTELLINPELIIHLNMAQVLIKRNTNLQKCKAALTSICRILEQLVVKNQDKMIIMKNQDFLQLLVENINKVISDQKISGIPAKLENFLINYLPKLFEYGLEIQKLQLGRIYELKLKSLSAPRQRLSRHDLERYRAGEIDGDFSEMLRDPDLDRKLQDFIKAFPGCLTYFCQKLSTTFKEIQQQLKNVDIFDNKPSQKVQTLLKLFLNEKVEANEGLINSFKTLLNHHPSVFAKASSSVNFSTLSNKLNVTEEQICCQLFNVLARLRQGLAVETVPVEDLCQKITTTNPELIELANMISRFHLLLKCRRKNTTFPFIKELLELTLIMEKVESISLNRIVRYQAAYSNDKIKMVKQFYRDHERQFIYTEMTKISTRLIQSCWDIFEDLDYPHLNILLREFNMYFETMIKLDDRNLVLRLMKRTYRNFSHINQKRNINLNFQLYAHNKSIIIQFFIALQKLISSTKVTSRDTAVMGESYLRFVEKNKRLNKDAAAQFNIIIIPHLQQSETEFIDFLYFKIRNCRNIYNRMEYSGQQNTLKIIRSIVCDTVKRLSNIFDLENINFYQKFINILESKSLSRLPNDIEQEKNIDIQEPQEILPLLTKEQKQSILTEEYLKTLEKIYQYRYTKTHLIQIQNIFFLLVTQLSERYHTPHQQEKLFITVLKQISQNEQNIEIDDHIFKNQCSWIDNILTKMKNFKAENVLSVNFVNKYIKLIQMMLSNPEEYKQSIPNSIIILEKLIPKDYSEHRNELIIYGQYLMEIINKVINCSIGFKKLNASILENITLTLINTKCSEYFHHIQNFLRILLNENKSVAHLLNQIIQKQTQLPRMEADIKALFLKQSENLVDQSQDKISIRLSTFINIFKYKYGNDVAAFSNLSSKFIKRTIKKDDKKQIIYVSYDKKNSFSYCQLLKKDFNQIQPSENLKIIIKNMLQLIPNSNNKNLQNKLQSLRDFLYLNPLMIPYVMLHPIKTQNGDVEFIDYLVNEASIKRSEYICDFLLFSCIDHSCMARIKDRTIFFGEYLCYRIIKQIIKAGINKYTLFLTYLLVQLKKFAYLCKIKLDRNDNKSLVNVLISHLRANREGFLYKNGDNNLIYLTMAIIFKQDSIDNLKKCFIPKRNKQWDKQYKIINESLIPFHVYFRKMKDNRKLQAREDNIAFTGTLITPFYSEMYEDVYMDDDYQSIEKFKYNLQLSTQEENSQQFQFENLLPHHLKAFTSLNPIQKYDNVLRQLATDMNQKHQVMIGIISKIYFKGENSDEVRSPRIEGPDSENAFMNQRNRSIRQIERTRERYRLGRGRGRGRGLARSIHHRNQPRTSRYAQEDFSLPENSQRMQKKTLEKQFEQSLNVIPSEEVIEEEISNPNFQDIKTGDEELELIISQINEKLFLLNKEPLTINELKGRTFQEKKQYLEIKDIELDFDFNKSSLTPEEFESYCLANSHRFQKLDKQRRQDVRKAEEVMYLLNLQRSYSSDSINHIIEAIDENYQYLNISRTISRSQSISSRDESLQFVTGQNFHFENGVVPIRAFSNIQEETIYEMLLSFYYDCDKFNSKCFMPFLQNKKIQNQIISTLLYLMKNPFNCKYFPNCTYKFNQNELNWTEVPITQSNQKIQHLKFNERVIAVFESVKNYSFHQDDNFLVQEIGNEGIFDIKYQPISKFIGQNTYIPIVEILEHCDQVKSIVISLLNGVKDLPEDKINQILQIIIKNDIVIQSTEQQHAFVMGRVFAVPKSSSNTFPFENMKELYKNNTFQAKFKEIYIFGTKNPTPAFLTHLIESGIYTTEELKTYQLQFLASGKDDPNIFKFLNKVISVYTDQQLKQATWIKDYREMLAKVLTHYNNYGISIEKEPISRILQLSNDLGYEIKKAIFEKQMDERKRGINSADFEDKEQRQVISKKQKGIFDSAFQLLRHKPDNFWLSHFGVKFINENGKRESGFGDGVRRQWFTLLTKGMVNLNYALFTKTPTNDYFFNRQSRINSRHLQYFEFIGKLLGYSLTKSRLFVSPSLSILLYKMILGEQITIDDILKQFQDEAYQIKSIKMMIEQIKSQKEYEAADVEIAFTYTDKKLLVDKFSNKNKAVVFETGFENVIKQLQKEEELQKLPQKVGVVNVKEIIELKPGGSNIFVTYDTMQEYLQLYQKKIYEIVVDSVKRQFNAFMDGFKRIINPKLISRFTAKELKLLAEGVHDIDIDDIQKYTRGDIDSSTASLLWSTLQGLSNEDRGMFLWNWTGADKMAAEGAKVMGLRISKARGPNFKAHTCSMHLEVPMCQTKEEMETAVTIVLNNIKTGQAVIED